MTTINEQKGSIWLDLYALRNVDSMDDVSPKTLWHYRKRKYLEWLFTKNDSITLRLSSYRAMDDQTG